LLLTFVPLYKFQIYFSASKVLTKVPIYGKISTLNSSPGFNVYFGFLAKPTPAGVPVIITVPGGRVVDCDKNEMILGIEKIRSSVPQSWRT